MKTINSMRHDISQLSLSLFGLNSKANDLSGAEQHLKNAMEICDFLSTAKDIKANPGTEKYVEHGHQLLIAFLYLEARHQGSAYAQKLQQIAAEAEQFKEILRKMQYMHRLCPEDSETVADYCKNVYELFA